MKDYILDDCLWSDSDPEPKPNTDQNPKPTKP